MSDFVQFRTPYNLFEYNNKLESQFPFRETEQNCGNQNNCKNSFVSSLKKLKVGKFEKKQ